MANVISTNVNRATDANGNPVAGAKAYFYLSGTSTPVTVYSDAAATTPHPTPVVADGNGVFPPIFGASAASLKVNVTTAAGAAVPGYPRDPVVIFADTTVGASAISFTPITGNAATNVQAAIANIQPTINGITPFAKTLLDDTTAGAMLTTLGVSAYAKTILDDADASAALTTLGFSGTIADPGTITIPNGSANNLILKWGVSGVLPNGGSAIVTFATAFPNACLRVLVGPIVSGTNTSAFSVGAYNLSASQFIATNNSGSSGSAQAAWIAIGR